MLIATMVVMVCLMTYGFFLVLIRSMVFSTWHSTVKLPYDGSFPSACAHPEGCTRVTVDAPNRGEGLQPLLLDARPEDAAAEAASWLSRAALSSHELWHGVHREGSEALVAVEELSFFWGFPDIASVRATDQGDGRSLLEVQSQLVLGSSDYGVNERRVQALWRHMIAWNASL